MPFKEYMKQEYAYNIYTYRKKKNQAKYSKQNSKNIFRSSRVIKYNIKFQSENVCFVFGLKEHVRAHSLKASIFKCTYIYMMVSVGPCNNYFYVEYNIL